MAAGGRALEPVSVPEVEQLLRQYHAAQHAAEAKHVERDAVALVNVPSHDPRHLDRKDAATRAVWTQLDTEMWQHRQRASEAWDAYVQAVLAGTPSA